MLSPKKSPRAVFCRQMKLKIANGDIGEAQRNPCNIQLLPSYEVNIESCQPEGVFQVKKIQN